MDSLAGSKTANVLLPIAGGLLSGALPGLGRAVAVASKISDQLEADRQRQDLAKAVGSGPGGSATLSALAYLDPSSAARLAERRASRPTMTLGQAMQAAGGMPEGSRTTYTLGDGTRISLPGGGPKKRMSVEQARAEAASLPAGSRATYDLEGGRTITLGGPAIAKPEKQKLLVSREQALERAKSLPAGSRATFQLVDGSSLTLAGPARPKTPAPRQGADPLEQIKKLQGLEKQFGEATMAPGVSDQQIAVLRAKADQAHQMWIRIFDGLAPEQKAKATPMPTPTSPPTPTATPGVSLERPPTPTPTPTPPPLPKKGTVRYRFDKDGKLIGEVQ